MEIDTLDIDLLKYISTREVYDDYGRDISKAMCTKESWQLVTDFGKYFASEPHDEIGEEFKLWFRITAHPGFKPSEHEHYTRIIDNVLEAEFPDPKPFQARLDELRRVAEVEKLTSEFSHGSIDYSSFVEKINKVSSSISSPSRGEDSIVKMTLSELSKDCRDATGIYWRLEDMNKSVGPIAKGDFVIIGKRPEAGGTSFVCSEMSYMLSQLPAGSRAVLFNNEEAPDKVYTRLVTAALDKGYREIMSDPTRYQTEYEEWLGGREFDLCHDTNMSLTSIREVLRKKEYDLIGVNVLLKVGGTSFTEDHDKFQKLGEEMRKIAQEYAPVLAVVQADPLAEGQRYLSQHLIYKSKTALQGEADVQLMIGTGEIGTSEDLRYIHVAKNKIPPSWCTLPSHKHVKCEVNFEQDTGRFTSRNYGSNSFDVKDKV
jgi:hypothetical protein